VVQLCAPVVRRREVAGGVGVRAVGLRDLRGTDEAGDLGGNARGRVACRVLPPLLGHRTVGKDAVRGALNMTPRSRVDAPELPGEQDRVGDLIELQAAPVW